MRVPLRGSDQSWDAGSRAADATRLNDPLCKKDAAALPRTCRYSRLSREKTVEMHRKSAIFLPPPSPSLNRLRHCRGWPRMVPAKTERGTGRWLDPTVLSP